MRTLAITHYPAFQPQTTCLLTKAERGLDLNNPALPLPSRSSQLVLLQVHLPQILRTAQGGDQRRASTSFSLLRGRQGSHGPRESPSSPICPSWGSPTLGWALEAMGMTTEALGSQPLIQHHLNALFGGNLWKTQLSLFSLLHPWAERRVRGSKHHGPSFLSSFWFPGFLWWGAGSGPVERH